MSCQKRKLCNFVRALKLPLCLVRGAIDDTERERQRVGSQMKRVGAERLPRCFLRQSSVPATTHRSLKHPLCVIRVCGDG